MKKEEEKQKEEHKHSFQFVEKQIWENGLGQTNGKRYALFMCSCGAEKRQEIED